MKPTHIFPFALLLCTAILFSCKTARTTVIRPYNYPDSTLTLRIPKRLPGMQLKTDSIVHLHVIPFDGTKAEYPTIRTRYIPLETTDECRIRSISKMESDDSILFIFDYFGQKVLSFSERDGSFLTKFNIPEQKTGNYYNPITGMGVDKKRKEVCVILYGESNKLLYFAYDGTPLREEPIYYYYSDIQYVGDNLVLLTGENKGIQAIKNNRLMIARHDQTPLAGGFYLPDTYDCNHRLHRGLQSCGEEVYYAHVLSDTIWQVRENGCCEARYVIKAPGRDKTLFSEEEIRTLTNEQYEARTKGTQRLCASYITRDFIYTDIFNGSSILYCIPTGHYLYNPHLPQKFHMPNLNFATHTLNGTSFVKELDITPIYRKHHNIKNLYDRNTFREYWEEEMDPEERKMLDAIQEEGNPLLMVFDVEPF
ncbi:MAG: 6-bladed beta-propeller [Paraprevotella sp.]|nr:6-bladed beta-propeller [Paraprevotella sp.]